MAGNRQRDLFIACVGAFVRSGGGDRRLIELLG